MGFVILLLIALSLRFCLCADDAELCPPANTISPCTCDGEGMNCMKVQSDSEIQRVMKSACKGRKYRNIWVQMTKMTKVPAKMFGDCEVQALHLEINIIQTVEHGALSGSEQSLATLSLFGNKLKDFIYSDLSAFVYLRSLNLGKNELTTIPGGAFANCQRLSEILLPENKINYVGPHAFHNTPSLQRLDLTHNRMNVLGPLSFAMTAHNPGLTISLANCTVSSVAQSAFDGTTPRLLNLWGNRLQHLEEASFLPMVQRMAKIGGQMEVSFNPFTCVGCHNAWLVINKNPLQFMFHGFRCVDGRTLQHLTRQNIRC